MGEFENQVMLYLRNIATKLINLDARLDALESNFMQGLHCNSEAFRQTKVVCQALANETRETKEHLEEYGGVIESSTYLGRTRVV